MAVERAGLINIELIRYRDPMEKQYIWFWVESGQGEILSPTFENKEDALYWGRETIEVVKNARKDWKI